MVAKVWSGGDGSWNDPANWSPPGVPTSADTVSINSGNVLLTSGTNARGTVTVGSSGRLTFEAGSNLATSGFVNHGHIEIQDGGQLSLSGVFDPNTFTYKSFVNTGTIEVNDGGLLNLALMTITPSNLTAGISNAGTIRLGVATELQLNGGNLDLADAGKLILAAAIRNGTIVDDGGNPPQFESPSFQNVTYIGDLNINASSQYVRILDGLSVLKSDGSQPGVFNLDGVGVELIFVGTGNITLDNMVINIGEYAEINAPGAMVDFGENAIINIYDSSLSSTIFAGKFVNKGAINVFGGADFNGDFRNDGSIKVTRSASFDGNLVGGGTLSLIDGASVSINVGSGEEQTIALINGRLTLAYSDLFKSTIDDFNDPEDVIELSEFGYDIGDTVSLGAGNVLTVTQIEGGVFTLKLDPSYDFSGFTFHLSNDPISGGTDITVTCFGSGTLIATPSGAFPIETLARGDLVTTSTGETRPIIWIGRQTVVPARADRLRHFPIKINAGALSAGVPVRDLYVSPDHAVLIEGLLVQAGALVNGATIERIEPDETFMYFHIELEDHSLILAEGTPAETFVDNVTRSHFDNFAEYRAHFGERGAHISELKLPRVKSARQLPRTIRNTIALRAVALGFRAAQYAA